MPIPDEIIQKINVALAIKGRPHNVYVQGQLPATDCWEWLLPADEVYSRFQEKLRQTQESPEQRDASRKSFNILSDQLFENVKRDGEESAQAKFAADLFNLLAKEIQDPQLMTQWVFGEKDQKTAEALSKVRSLIGHSLLLAYVSHQQVDDELIVVAPTTNQFDILRIEGTDGANYDLDTEDVIEKLTELDEKYGIDVTGATSDSVQFRLQRIPTDHEMQALGEWLLQFCPDLETAPRELTDGEVFLWWD